MVEAAFFLCFVIVGGLLSAMDYGPNRWQWWVVVCCMFLASMLASIK